MQCERLIKLVKTWYIHVKEETMAPARMVQFIKEHAEECPICLKDADIADEISRITEIVLPESKIPKAVRMKQEMEEAKQEEAEAAEAAETAETAETAESGEAEEEKDQSEEENEENDNYVDEEEEVEEPLAPDAKT